MISNRDVYTEWVFRGFLVVERHEWSIAVSARRAERRPCRRGSFDTTNPARISDLTDMSQLSDRRQLLLRQSGNILK